MRKRSLHLAQQAIDRALDAVPSTVVERVTSVSAPLSRYSGRTRAGAAALAAALETLAQPSRRRRRDRTVSVAELAVQTGRSHEDIERWAASGLLGESLADGRWDAHAADRAVLAALVMRRGASEQEVLEAARQGRLPLLALERTLSGDAVLSGRQVADRAGVPLDTAMALWRALGLPVEDPDEPAFTRQEVWALRMLGALRSVYTDSDLVEGSSVVGRAMAEVSAAAVELFRRRLTTAFVEAGMDDLEIALRLAAAADLLVPTFGPLLEVVLRRHLAVATGAEAALHMAEPGSASTQQLSIVFVDLVGFTSLSEQLSALEVAALAARLLRTAEEATASTGARIVKSIGDAVMLAARDPVVACSAAVLLMEMTAREAGMPPVRAGIAHGPVLRAYADYFGSTVNIAARLSDVARGGEVLLHAPDAHVAGAAWSAAGLKVTPGSAVRLKGIDQRVAVARVTRAEPGSAP